MARAFGTALREHRARLKISQEEFAYRAGLDRTFTSLLERGLRAPTPTVFFTIAEGLDVPPAELLRDTLANFERRATQSG
jgi:transcriptional regulator with XRE-family HTH domain